MLILAIDTSSRRCSVALLRDEAVLAETGGVTEEPYASRVFGDVNRILSEAGAELSQIEVFAVASGPGSFTGLRVGLTAVKGWAEVFGRPIAPVSALEAVAIQARGPGRVLLPVVDGRGGHFFGAAYEREAEDGAFHLDGRIVGDEVALSAEEYFRWVEERLKGQAPVFITPTAEVFRGALAASQLAAASVEEVSGELAPFIGRLGYARALRGEVVDALALEANYVRRSDAEVKWRG